MSKGSVDVYCVREIDEDYLPNIHMKKYYCIYKSSIYDVKDNLESKMKKTRRKSLVFGPHILRCSQEILPESTTVSGYSFTDLPTTTRIKQMESDAKTYGLKFKEGSKWMIDVLLSVNYP